MGLGLGWDYNTYGMGWDRDYNFLKYGIWDWDGILNSGIGTGYWIPGSGWDWDVENFFGTGILSGDIPWWKSTGPSHIHVFGQRCISKIPYKNLELNPDPNPDPINGTGIGMGSQYLWDGIGIQIFLNMGFGIGTGYWISGSGWDWDVKNFFGIGILSRDIPS